MSVQTFLSKTVLFSNGLPKDDIPNPKILGEIFESRYMFLQSQYSGHREPGSAAPKACCFPNAYKDFYYLAVDYLENLYVEKSIEMIATKCSCR